MNIPIIVGPTSSGKTSLALKLSTKIGADIISADSRQVYKFLDVGTGKLPTGLSKQNIQKGSGFWKVGQTTIWGYDLVTLDQTFNAYDFSYFALDKIRELSKQKISVIIVGGTGFFVDCLVGKIELSVPQSDWVLREKLNKKTLEELNNDLQNISQNIYEVIDKKNKVRVIRAIERLMLPKSEKVNLDRAGLNFEYFGLNAPRDILYSRADKWAETIWGEDLFAEVDFLVKSGFKDAPSLNGIVYKTAQEYLGQLITSEQGLERVKFDLHAYIRRQQTWFKKNASINWFDIAKGDEIVAIISDSLYT